jgi:hypothetical protein
MRKIILTATLLTFSCATAKSVPKTTEELLAQCEIVENQCDTQTQACSAKIPWESMASGVDASQYAISCVKADTACRTPFMREFYECAFEAMGAAFDEASFDRCTENWTICRNFAAQTMSGELMVQCDSMVGECWLYSAK